MAYCKAEIRKEDRLENVEPSPIFDSFKTAKYHALTTYIVGKIFRENVSKLGWTPMSMTSAENVQLIGKAIRAELRNAQLHFLDPAKYPDSEYKNMSDESFLDIFDEEEGTGILPNFKNYIAHYFKYNPIISVNDFELEEEETDEESQDDNENEASDDNAGELVDTTDLVGKKDFDRDGQGTSMVSLADKEVKMIIKLLPKMVWNEAAKKSELFLTQDGLPTVVDFSPTFNLLLDRISGIRDWADFKSRFKDMDLTRVVPEAQELGKILKMDKAGRDMTTNEIMLVQNFYQIFSKSKIPIYSVLKQDNGNSFLIDEIPGNRNNIRQMFVSNFASGNLPESMKKYVINDELTGYYLNKATFLERDPATGKYLIYPDTEAQQLDFLGLLGFRFSGVEFLDTESKRADYEDMLKRTTDYMFKSLQERLNAGQVIKSPLADLEKPYKPTEGKTIKSEKASVDELINFEGKYSTVTPTLSTRNAEGELQYLISLDNQLSIATYHLNNSETLEELYDSPVFKNNSFNPLFKNSHIIKYLFDKNGKKIRTFNGNPVDRRVELGNLSGYKTQVGGKKVTAKLERNLSTKDKITQDINMMLNDFMTDVMRTETSNTFFTIALTENGKRVPYFAMNTFLSDFKSSAAWRGRMFNYLTGEIERIKSYDQKKKENPTLTVEYGKFSIFYDLFENGANPAVRKALLSEDLTQASPAFQQFLDLYEEEMNNKLSDLKFQLQDLGVNLSDKEANDYLIAPNIINKNEGIDLDGFLRAFIANTLVQNIEFATAFSGDPLFFTKKSKDNNPLNDAAEYHKRVKMLSSTGDLASTTDVLNDFLQESTYAKNFHENYSIAGALGVAPIDNSRTFKTQVIEEFRPNKDFAYNKPEMIDGIMTSLVKRDGDVGRMTREELENNYLKERGGQKPGDGQGYVSLDGARDLSFRFGFNTPELETVYKYEGLVFRKFLTDNPLTKEQEEEYNALKTLITENPEKYGHGIWKVIYTGGNEATTVASPHYDKFAIAPLLPSDVVNNPVLSKLLIDMTKGGYTYVKYESGSKLFRTKPVAIDKLGEHTEPDIFQTQLLKMQIRPKKTQNTSTTIPTQMLKLIFSNMFSEGKSKFPQVRALYTSYINTLQGIQKIQAEELMNELGISGDDIDMEKFSSRMVEQAKRQGQNSNVIQGLTYTPGDTSGALEQSGFLKQVNAMISGLADTRLRRFEFTGGDFVLETNANRGPLKFYKYNDIKTEVSDCRITLTKEFSKLLSRKHPDGKRIKTLERLNELLNNQEWRNENAKSLTIILDRVPTDGPHSMDFAMVREFLSPTKGNVVILADEIVYKSGTDFDYDKEKVIAPSFDQDGNYIDFETTTRSEIDKKLAPLEQLKKDIVDKNDELIKDIVARTTAANIMSNELVDDMTRVATALREEANMYAEYIRNGILEAQALSNEPENYSQLLYKRGSSFINALFDTDFDYDTIKATLDQDTLDYRDALGRRKDVIEDLEKQINDYRVLRGEAGAQVAELEDANYPILSEIKDLLRKKGQLLDNQGNKLVDIYQEVLAQPEMFAELLLPNSTSDIGPVATEIGEKTNERANLPMHSDVFDYSQNLYVKDIYFFAKRMLGPFAVDNTFLQLMQYSGININRQYYRYGKKKNLQTIHNMLLTQDQLNQVSKNGTLRTSLSEDVAGYLKQHWDSQSINATVDAAKDPWFAMLKIVNQNIGVVNFMKNIGIPFPTIVTFINQPVLLKFYEMQQNGVTKSNAIMAISKELGLYRLKQNGPSGRNKEQLALLKAKEGVTILSEKKVNSNEWNVKWTVQEYPTKQWQFVNLLKQIDAKESLGVDYAHLTPILNYANNPQESYEGNLNTTEIKRDSDTIRTFAHFVMMDQHNQAFSNFRYYFNFDTTKNSTATAVRQKAKQRQLLLAEGMFNESDIEKMEKFSIQSAYMNNELLQNVYNKIFPIIGKAQVQDAFQAIQTEYEMSFPIRNKKTTRDLPEITNSDFMKALVFNYVKIGNETFFQKNKHLLIKEKDKKTMAERLEALKALPFFPQLSQQFPVLKSLVVNDFMIEDEVDKNGYKMFTKIRNIQLLKPASETTIEAEGTIQQMRDLQTYQIAIQGISEEQNATYSKALHAFMTDLFTVGIIQSGMDASHLGYSEYIPYEFKKALATEALTNFGRATPAQLNNFLQKFKDKFRINNPRYFPSIEIDEQTTQQNNNRYSSRFKDYNIPADFANAPIEAPKKKGAISESELTDDLLNDQLAMNQDEDVEESQSSRSVYTGTITSLKPNQIFVFGSNPEGRHGAGAAKLAKDKFGAIYNQGRGLQGQSYGLVTKNLKAGFKEANGTVYEKEGERSVSPEQIKQNIQELYNTGNAFPGKEFLVAYSGTGKNLNGYTPKEMADMFSSFPIPANIIFEEGFSKLLTPIEDVEGVFYDYDDYELAIMRSKDEEIDTEVLSDMYEMDLNSTDNWKDEIEAMLSKYRNYSSRIGEARAALETGNIQEAGKLDKSLTSLLSQDPLFQKHMEGRRVAAREVVNTIDYITDQLERYTKLDPGNIAPEDGSPGIDLCVKG